MTANQSHLGGYNQYYLLQYIWLLRTQNSLKTVNVTIAHSTPYNNNASTLIVNKQLTKSPSDKDTFLLPIINESITTKIYSG